MSQSQAGLHSGAGTLVFNFCSRWEELRHGICFTCFHTCESVLAFSTNAKPPRKAAGTPTEERVQSPGLGGSHRSRRGWPVSPGGECFTCTHTHTHVYTCTHLHVHARACTHVYTRAHTETRVHAETRVHVHTHRHTCAQRHMYTCINIDIHVCTQRHIHVHTHRHTRVHTETHVHVHTHTCTYIQTFMHTPVDTCARPCCSPSLVAKSCLTVCDPMDCSRSGFPVLHCLPEFAHACVH